MFDLVNEFTYSDGRREAQAWLAHRLTWERLISDLRERHDGVDAPVSLGAPVEDEAAAA